MARFSWLPFTAIMGVVASRSCTLKLPSVAEKKSFHSGW